MNSKLWKLADKGWQLLRWIDRTLPPAPTVLPLKFTGVVHWRGGRERVRLGIRHDLAWDQYYARSKTNPAYWYSLRGAGKQAPNRRFFILQVADLIIEWRLGAKGLDRE